MNESAEQVMNRVMGPLLAYRARIDSDTDPLTLEEAARALSQEPEIGLTETGALDLLSQPPADVKAQYVAAIEAEHRDSP